MIVNTFIPTKAKKTLFANSVQQKNTKVLMNRDNTQSQRAMFVITNKKTTRLTTHAKIATICNTKGHTMNKLNKILWGIISFGISAIYRVDTNASHYTSMMDALGAGSKDSTISVSCPQGTVNLLVTKFGTATGNLNQFTGGGTCRDEQVCETNDTTPKSCTNNQTASNTTTAIDPDSLTCKTLICPDSGILSKMASVKKYQLKQTAEFGCVFATESGARASIFSFIVTGITSYSGYKAHYTKTGDGSATKYDAYWTKLTNNAITDCYIKKETGSDSSGNFTYESPQKCYYE